MAAHSGHLQQNLALWVRQPLHHQEQGISLVIAMRHGTVVAPQLSRTACSSLPCLNQWAAPVWLAEQSTFYLHRSQIDFFCQPEFCDISKWLGTGYHDDSCFVLRLRSSQL